MEMTSLIYHYYQGERNTAVLAALLGLVLLVGAFIGLYYQGNDRFIRGLSNTLLAAALFFLVSGIGVIVHNRRKMVETHYNTQSDRDLLHAETQRMEIVLTKGYRSALLLFTALVASGLVLVMTNPESLWKGFALGLLITGALGHTMEAFSMQKNKAYQQKLLTIHQKNIPWKK